MQDILTDLEDKRVLASIFRRWLACFIDLMLSLTVSVIGGITFGEKLPRGGWTIHGIGGELNMILPWLLFLPGIEIFNNGQTIGKVLFRLRTIRADGSKLTPGISLLKHLFDIIDYLPGVGMLGMIVAGATRKKQRVGDLVAKTIVIEIGGK